MPAMGERTRTTRSVVLGLAAFGAICAIAIYLRRYGLAGLAVDRAAVRGWLHGDGLYAYRSPVSRLGTAQPPPAAVALIAADLLPLTLSGWLLGLAGVAALALALTALAGPVARQHGKPRWPAVLIACGLALLSEPVRTTIGCGRLDLLLFGLVTADVVALRRSGRARSRDDWWPGCPPSPARSGRLPARGPDAWWPGRPPCPAPRGRLPADVLRRGWAQGAWAGVGTGVATALAVSPVLFIAYLALTRRWRAALTALGTAATLTVAAHLVAPPAAADWFGTVLLQVDRSGPVGTPVNQSLAGVLARLYHSETIPVLIWLSFAGLLIAVGLTRARSAHADGDEIAAFTLVGLTSAAVGPVTHLHELIWVLPAVLILVDVAARRVAGRRPRPAPSVGALLAAVLVYAAFVLDPAWTVGWNAYAFAVIILLNALPWRPARPIVRVPAIPGQATGS